MPPAPAGMIKSTEVRPGLKMWLSKVLYDASSGELTSRKAKGTALPNLSIPMANTKQHPLLIQHPQGYA